VVKLPGTVGQGAYTEGRIESHYIKEGGELLGCLVIEGKFTEFALSLQFLIDSRLQHPLTTEKSTTHTLPQMLRITSPLYLNVDIGIEI